jgi:uncharacterized protein with HEPN domain
MPPRDWTLRITDILDSIAVIREFTAGMDYAAFSHDRKTIDAVLRNFTVIGEAARHMPDDVTAAHPAIPWQDMCDMRNILMHQYFGVNLRIVWDTIHVDLPPLALQLQRILEGNAE